MSRGQLVLILSILALEAGIIIWRLVHGQFDIVTWMIALVFVLMAGAFVMKWLQER